MSSVATTSGSTVSNWGLAYRIVDWATSHSGSGPSPFCDSRWRLDGASLLIGIFVGLFIYGAVESLVTAKWAVIHWTASTRAQSAEVRRPKELYKLL